MGNKILLIGIITLIAGCSSSGSSSSQYKIMSANKNAISIRVAMSGYSDQGQGLAQDHCSKHGKVATYESATGNGYRSIYTYLCN